MKDFLILMIFVSSIFITFEIRAKKYQTDIKYNNDNSINWLNNSSECKFSFLILTEYMSSFLTENNKIYLNQESEWDNDYYIFEPKNVKELNLKKYFIAGINCKKLINNLIDK